MMICCPMKYTEIHRYAPYGNVQKEKKTQTENEIKHKNNTKQHTVQTEYMKTNSVLNGLVSQRVDVFL